MRTLHLFVLIHIRNKDDVVAVKPAKAHLVNSVTAHSKGVLLFSLGQCTKWVFLGGSQNFKYFGGMPNIPDIFCVNSRCWV